jgi:hypothetical protein
MEKFKTYLLSVLIVVFGVIVVDFFDIIPKKDSYVEKNEEEKREYYVNSDFNIKTLVSKNDKDSDGIDDYRDIMLGAREYVLSSPKYESGYYDGGYPPEGVGVCTDVIWKGFKNAGYDLKKLIDEDIWENLEEYESIRYVDKNIDFRRVPNLKVFFERHAEVLTTDIYDIDEWQAGDIVVFPGHIAIISEKRNKDGIPYIIHHGGEHTGELDNIMLYTIEGHYRWNG